MRSFILSAVLLAAFTTSGAEAARRGTTHTIDCDKQGCFALMTTQARAPRFASSPRDRHHHRAKAAKARTREVVPLPPTRPPELRGSLSQAVAPPGIVAKLEADADKPPLAIMVDKARQYLGKTASQLGLPTSLWCADFVNMITGGGTHDRMARSWLNRPRLARPEPGAVVVFSRGRSGVYGHVGVLTGFDKAGNPIVVAGNAGGSRVRESQGRKERVLAYVMPPLPRPQGLLEAGGPWVSRALA